MSQTIEIREQHIISVPYSDFVEYINKKYGYEIPKNWQYPFHVNTFTNSDASGYNIVFKYEVKK